MKYEPIDMNEYLRFILHNFSFDNTYQADRVLKKHYETAFEIFDHRTKSTKGLRPWSGMAALDNNLPDKTVVSNLIDEYNDCGVKEVLNMTFLEYINLPKTVAEEIRHKARSIHHKMQHEQQLIQSENERMLKAAASGPPKNSPGANPMGSRQARTKDM